MFGINSKIVILHVRNTSGDVIGLINGKTVEAGRQRRTQDCQQNQLKCETYEQIALDIK